jgi:ubiquinone/menaquinone biosynthesis C-methylase UbiE
MVTDTAKEVYARKPLGFQGSIPIFSRANEYTDNYERISADHLVSFYREGKNPFIPEEVWVQMENSTIELVKKYSSPGDRILDVGVGLGRLLSHFPQLQRYGIDISLGYLRSAQEKGIEVCYSLVEDLPYGEATFDIVVCTDVLEHVIDINLSVQKILSVLKPDGFLIVRTPYREDLSFYVSRKNPYKYVHLRTFDENSLRLLFERVVSCKVVETQFSTYMPNRNRLKYLIPFPKGGAILGLLIKALRPALSSAIERLLRKWYYPIEINVVVRKPAHDGKPSA